MDTIITMADSQPGASVSSDARRESIRARLTECDVKLERYKNLLIEVSDPKLVADWINQAQAERVLLEREMAAIPESIRLSHAQIAHIVRELGSVVAGLDGADPEKKQKLYGALGLRLTYKPKGHVLIESRPAACTQVGVGGGTCPPATRETIFDL